MKSTPSLLAHRTFRAEPGKPWVVLVHGAGGSRAVWFRQLRALAPHFSVLLLDLRGHGQSAALHIGNTPYSLQSLTQDILDVMDHLGIARAHFIGLSLGTVLIQQLTRMAPERVLLVVFSGAILAFGWRVELFIWGGHLLKHVVPFRWLYRTFAWVVMPGRSHREARVMFNREAAQLSQAEFIRWYNISGEMRQVINAWKTAPSPHSTLLLMGSGDYLFLSIGRRLAKLYSHIQLDVVPEAGHVVNVEAATNYNARLLAFLNGNPPLWP